MSYKKKTSRFEYEFCPVRSVCNVKGVGESNFKESINAINYIANHPEFKVGFKIFFDLVETNYHPSYEELQGIVDVLKSHKENFKNRIALVTQPKMSIVAKLVSIYCELAGMQMKSFQSISEAKEWISESET